MRDLKVETTGLEISSDAEVMEVAETASDALSHLEQTIYGFNGGISQTGLEIGEDAMEVFFEGTGEFAKGLESGAVRPAQPPTDGGEITIGQDFLESLAQGDGAPEGWVGAGQRATQVKLLLGARPFVAADGPESAGQIGPLFAQALTNGIKCLSGQFHDMEEIEDNAGVGKVGLHSGDVGRTHVHNHLSDRFGPGPVSRHRRNELRHGFGAASFDHEQQVMAFGVKHHGHVAMALPRTGLIDHDPAHPAPVLGRVGFHDVVIEHSPKPFIALPQLRGHRRYAHLLTEQQDHGLHHQEGYIKNPIDRTMEAAMEKDPSTAGMIQAISDADVQWDKRMNSIYNSLRKAMEPDEWKSLVSAQKAWVNYRDLQMASIEATFSRMDGTMWRPVSASRVMEITKERALFLEALLENVSER